MKQQPGEILTHYDNSKDNGSSTSSRRSVEAIDISNEKKGTAIDLIQIPGDSSTSHSSLPSLILDDDEQERGGNSKQKKSLKNRFLKFGHVRGDLFKLKSSRSRKNQRNSNDFNSSSGSNNSIYSDNNMGLTNNRNRKGLLNSPAFMKTKKAILKYMKFIGPGAMTAVSYIDAGNFSSSVYSGAQFKYRLLFIMFFSSCIAVFLQTLAIRLGTVTGRDLAQLSREHLPKWVNLILYVLAEVAIIATDIAEVVGTAVALNILFHIPLIVGVLLTIIDVMLVLMAYRAGKSVKFIYYFEYGVAALVLGVVICLALQLANIPPTSASEVFRGFIPSNVIFQNDAMYAACSILGATVMPHSLYLGSSIVKPRLLEKDINLGNTPKDYTQQEFDNYRPSLAAIRYSLNFSVIELCVSLFTFALFVNAAILIVAGATLYGTKDANDADLYSIYYSLCNLLSQGSGTLFMVALLLSGQSAGIVVTIAGQVVSEGHLTWKIKPWQRRIITRALAIIPCLVVSACVGKRGISGVLNASQVALSILLPFLVLPLIYFTCQTSIMSIGVQSPDGIGLQESDSSNSPTTEVHSMTPFTERNIEVEDANAEVRPASQVSSMNQEMENGTSNIKKQAGRVGSIPLKAVNFKNNWIMMIISVLIWLFIAILNVYLIVQLGMGRS